MFNFHYQYLWGSPIHSCFTSNQHLALTIEIFNYSCKPHLQWSRQACHPGSVWKPSFSSGPKSRCPPLGRGTWGGFSSSPLFFSFKMLAPGKPEQVEIFPRERLSDQIGHGCLQPLNHFNLNLGEVWGENWQKTFFSIKNVVVRSFDNNKSMPVFSPIDWQH